jgi:predicted metal-binding protein
MMLAGPRGVVWLILLVRLGVCSVCGDCNVGLCDSGWKVDRSGNSGGVDVMSSSEHALGKEGEEIGRVVESLRG